MKRTFILIILFIVLGNFGCSKKTENTEKAITSLIYKNIKCIEDEDLKGYMSTISKDSPLYDNTKKQLKLLFKVYDLTYKIDSIKIIEESKNEAKVRVVQVTKKVNGPAFRDNRLTLLDILKKSKGKWKIFKTNIENIEYLN